MKNNLNRNFVVIIVFTAITMIVSVVGIVFNAIFNLAKGNILSGVLITVCLLLLFVVSALSMAFCISWKVSSMKFVKYDNDKPDFYEQQKIDN